MDRWMDETREGPAATLGPILHYYGLSLPFLFLQVAPFVTLMAAMFTVNRLLKKNEVTPALSAGVSTHRILLPVYLASALLGVAMVGLREVASDWIADQRERVHHRLEHRTEEVVYERVVVRDFGGSIAILDRFLPAPADGGPPTIEGLAVRLRRDGHYLRVEAPRARWEGGRWRLEGGERSRLAEETSEREPAEVLREFDLTPELALTYRRARDVPLELSFGEVRRLVAREPDRPDWLTLWHYHLTFALANLILVLVGVPLMFTYERGHGAERMALGGLLCVFYFGVDFVLRSLGLSGGLSPLFAAWLPVLVFGSLGIMLTDGQRT